MRSIRLTDEALGSPVALQLKTMLENILQDNVIEYNEVDRLRRWTEQHMEHSDEIPAISHLSWILQTVLADQAMEPFEWAMLRASIEKVLPEKQQESLPPLLDSTRTTNAPPVIPDNGDEWVIVDTETSGLFAPIYAVEIAAQRMRGWKRHGQPFRILLNHDVDLEPAAVATHGYTREFLKKNGIQPQKAHDHFSEYANGLHMVAHNLAYDFNRVLEPEWARLRRSTICPAGFCTVMLSRRCLPQIASASLGSLGTQFGLGDPSHHAGDDVNITVKLFTDVLAPKLDEAGIKTFQQAKEFSRKTPLAECRKLFHGAPVQSTPRVKRPSSKARKFQAFIGQLTEDHTITNHEFIALQQWLETEGAHSSDATHVADLVEKILADGQVTDSELASLGKELSKLSAT